MAEQVETEAVAKKSIGLMDLLGWLAIILTIYVLSSGPVARMFDKNKIPLNSKEERFLSAFYAPLGWAYESTPLHKPLGMYMHLWSKRFDKNGDFRMIF